MPNRFSSAKFSISQCDRCGFRFKLTKLKSLTIKTKNVNILVCPECWEQDHPQLQLGLYPVNDPQAVRNPRPDFAEYPESRSYTEAINNGVGIGLAVGTLTEIVTVPKGFFGEGFFAGGYYSGGYFFSPVTSVDGVLLTESGDSILLESGDRLMIG